MSFSRRPKEKQRPLCLSLMFSSSCQSEQKFTNCRYKSLIKSESFNIKSYPRIFTKLEMWSWHQLSICPTRGPIHFKTIQGFQVCLDHSLHFSRIPQWSSEWNFISLGVSLNGGTPISHPKCWSFLVGKPVVVGYHHYRKPPHGQ